MSRRKATPKEREAMHKTQPKRVLHVYGRTCNKKVMMTQEATS